MDGFGGEVALVTGGAGAGSAVAAQLAREGVLVMRRVVAA